MTTGPLIGLTLAAVLAAVLAVDGIVWLMGGETFTQWYIRSAQQHGWLDVIASTAIVAAAVWLFWHLEIYERL